MKTITEIACDELEKQLQQKQSKIDELVEFIDKNKHRLLYNEFDEAELLIQKHTKK